MAKIIKIEKCAACPHNSHRGGFGAVQYVPWCGKAQRSQPYDKHVNGNRVAARQNVDIPDWCPLEDHQVSIPPTEGLRPDITDIAP